MAYNTNIAEGHICSLIDAKNNNAYCGIFDNKYSSCEEYIADDINKLLVKTEKYDDIIFVGDGAVLHKDILRGTFATDNNIHAKNVGIAGYNKYSSGIKENADTVLPIYLRPSQAERTRNNI